jgi:hypothetical protein
MALIGDLPSLAGGEGRARRECTVMEADRLVCTACPGRGCSAASCHEAAGYISYYIMQYLYSNNRLHSNVIMPVGPRYCSRPMLKLLSQRLEFQRIKAQQT